jgi:hypothetical protein
MKGVCDHPNFWVELLLDGFRSHLDTDALLVFSEYKILVIKEEGDRSQVSQAYNQMVARANKRKFKELLDTVRAHTSLSSTNEISSLLSTMLLI